MTLLSLLELSLSDACKRSIVKYMVKGKKLVCMVRWLAIKKIFLWIAIERKSNTLMLSLQSTQRELKYVAKLPDVFNKS